MKQVPSFHRKKLVQWGFSDDSIANLERYAFLVEQWQKAINLVSPSTIPQIWDRHIMDSAQLWPLIKSVAINGSGKTGIIDLGSGGGFPALVLAIAGADHVTMIESDTRKCVFMREVARETGLANVTVISKRIEDVDPVKASFVTARALTSLRQLYDWGLGFAENSGHMIFLKGQDARNEIAQLPASIQKTAQLANSFTDPRASIVIIPVSRET